MVELCAGVFFGGVGVGRDSLEDGHEAVCVWLLREVAEAFLQGDLVSEGV